MTPSGFLSSTQIVKITTLVVRTLDFSGASSSSDFTALFKNFGTFTPLVFNSGASYHMIFNKAILTNCSLTHDYLFIYLCTLLMVPLL